MRWMTYFKMIGTHKFAVKGSYGFKILSEKSLSWQVAQLEEIKQTATGGE